MSSSMNTILVLGGTGGIGEAFARRWVSMGKQVVLTGRRQDRLDALKKEMPSLHTYRMDMSDLKSLPQDMQTLQKHHPNIDTVWVNGGIQGSFWFKDASAWTDEKVIQEMNTNAIAPILVARHFIPHLLALKKEVNFMFTSSGIAFVPAGPYPAYSASKGAVHHFAVALRQQMKGTNVNVIEIAPPYVETQLDANHKEAAGGYPPMPLQEYTDETFKILDSKDAKDLKEVGVGFAAMGAEAWRSSIGAVLEKLGFGG
jgi:uncharacterized oxidoreductase